MELKSALTDRRQAFRAAVDCTLSKPPLSMLARHMSRTHEFFEKKLDGFGSNFRLAVSRVSIILAFKHLHLAKFAVFATAAAAPVAIRALASAICDSQLRYV